MKIQVIGVMSDGSDAPVSIISTAKYLIDDPTIAYIKDGVVVPLKNGTTTLWSNINGIKTSTIIKVTTDVELLSLSVNINTLVLKQGNLINIELI